MNYHAHLLVKRKMSVFSFPMRLLFKAFAAKQGRIGHEESTTLIPMRLAAFRIPPLSEDTSGKHNSSNLANNSAEHYLVFSNNSAHQKSPCKNRGLKIQ
jgi:hypothetical protein